eukprot:6837684-Karenia_brevis.AAC.1
MRGSDDQGGVTWLELYLLAMAHAPEPPAQHTQAVARQSIGRSLQAFKVQAMRYVEFALTESAASLFRPSRDVSNRLYTLGFVNTLP